MKNRSKDLNKKEKGSDDESESLNKVQDEQSEEQQIVVRTLTAQEREERELESAQVIPDSEISPAAIVFMQQEQEDEINLFEQKSSKIKCPYCDAVSYSIVEYRPSLLGYLMVILSMLIFGFLSLVLLPFLISLTKQALHRCAKCLNEVKDSSYFGMTSMEDKLVSLQIGSFGIILTRRFLLYIVMVLSASMAIYLFVLNEEGHNHEAKPISGITWNRYKGDCGYDAFMQNPKEASHQFNRKYFGKGVSWDGYVIRVSFNDEDPLSMAFHSASLLIKMDGDDNQNAHGADVGLSLSERILTANRDVIDQLRKGDHIQFNSTLQSLGDRNHLHHLHTFAIKKLDGHMDVEAHAHANGRYKLAPSKKPIQDEDKFPGIAQDPNEHASNPQNTDSQSTQSDSQTIENETLSLVDESEDETDDDSQDYYQQQQT